MTKLTALEALHLVLVRAISIQVTLLAALVANLLVGIGTITRTVT